MTWGGEYSQFLEAKEQMYFIVPLAVGLIFMILFALYGNFKFPATIALGVIMTEPVGALVALKLTHTPFSVSSVLGLLALLGVSVETAVILVSYINKLRLEGMDITDSHQGSIAVAASSDHDDRPGCMPRIAAGGPFHRHRFGHAEAFRHRDRRWADFPPFHRLLREPRAVRDRRSRRRRPPGIGIPHSGRKCVGRTRVSAPHCPSPLVTPCYFCAIGWHQWFIDLPVPGC